jgi:hypothetical protein
MSSREKLIALRPSISSIQTDRIVNKEELFQNEILRPILKFQNDLLLEMYTVHINKHQHLFYSLTIPQRLSFIKESFQKDQLLKNLFLGVILGLMTQEEYQTYCTHEKELKRRLSAMLIQRLQDQVGKFDI